MPGLGFRVQLLRGVGVDQLCPPSGPVTHSWHGPISKTWNAQAAEACVLATCERQSGSHVRKILLHAVYLDILGRSVVLVYKQVMMSD